MSGNAVYTDKWTHRMYKYLGLTEKNCKQKINHYPYCKQSFSELRYRRSNKKQDILRFGLHNFEFDCGIHTNITHKYDGLPPAEIYSECYADITIARMMAVWLGRYDSAFYVCDRDPNVAKLVLYSMKVPHLAVILS